MEVKKIIESTLKNNGGTFDPSTLETADIRKGYIVALPGHEKKIQLGGEEKDLEKEVRKYIENKKDILMSPGVFLGTWIHENDLYLDTVEVILDRSRAIELGRERNQIGIWDCASQSEILL